MDFYRKNPYLLHPDKRPGWQGGRKDRRRFRSPFNRDEFMERWHASTAERPWNRAEEEIELELELEGDET